MKTKLNQKIKLALFLLTYLAASPAFAEMRHDLSALNGRWFVKTCTLNDRGNPIQINENGWTDDHECAEAKPDGIEDCHLDITVDSTNNSITFKNAPGELIAFEDIDQGKQTKTYVPQSGPYSEEVKSRARSFENGVMQEYVTRDVDYSWFDNLFLSGSARSGQSLKINSNGIMHFEHHDENEHLDCDLMRSVK